MRAIRRDSRNSSHIALGDDHGELPRHRIKLIQFVVGANRRVIGEPLVRDEDDLRAVLRCALEVRGLIDVRRGALRSGDLDQLVSGAHVELDWLQALQIARHRLPIGIRSGEKDCLASPRDRPGRRRLWRVVHRAAATVEIRVVRTEHRTAGANGLTAVRVCRDHLQLAITMAIKRCDASRDLTCGAGR